MEFMSVSRRDLLPAAGPALNLRAALYRAARDFRGGINALAITLGISPDDLAKRLNPTDNRPIRPEVIEEIIEATGDARVLDAVTRPAGAIWYRPVAVEASPDALTALGKLLEMEGQFVASLAKSSADGRWEAHEVVELEAHGRELIGKLLGIMAGARAALEGHDDV